MTLFDQTSPAIDRFADEYAFLSSFHPVAVRLDGDDYPTVEHAYHASKTFVAAERMEIALARTPGQAKRLGRRVTLRTDWSLVRATIMSYLVQQKFDYPPLGELLIATYPRRLVEGNYWHDQFWGDCRCGRLSCVAPGQNSLGDILMMRRWVLVKRS